MNPRMLLSLVGFGLAIAAGAFAQTSVRAPVDVTGVQTGVPCDATLGRALSTTASGAIICTDRVANSNNATTADTAATATTATTATNALNAVNASNLTGTLSASQISGGTLDPSLIPAGSGGAGNAQVVCVSKSVSVGGSMYSPQYSQSFSFSMGGTLPSLGATQSTSISLSGSVSNPYAQGCANPAGGSATVTCNANGQFSVSWTASGSFATMGCLSNGDGTTGACSCNNVGSGSASGSGNY